MIRMKIGFCKTAITPPIGMYLAGFSARSEPSRGVLDDLYVRCTALSIEGEVALLATLDQLAIDLGFRDKIASYVSDRLGIPQEHVIVCATHTHSAPYVYENDAYAEYLARSVAGCLTCAYGHMHEVRKVVMGRSYAPELVYNRRDPFRGVVDPELAVLLFKRSAGDVVFVNFSSHPVVLGPNNLYISSDYPGALLRFLDKILGFSSSTFYTGCAGNVNPFTSSTDLKNPYDRSRSSYSEVLDYARILGGEVLKALSLNSISRNCDGFGLLCRNVRLKVRKGVEELLREELKKFRDSCPRQSLWYVDILRRMLSRIGNGFVTTRVCVLALAGAALYFLPSEPFVEHQLFLKERSPYEMNMVVSYANDYVGYIPTQDEFEKGGYEVGMSIVERGEGEKLRDVALELAGELVR